MYKKSSQAGLKAATDICQGLQYPLTRSNGVVWRNANDCMQDFISRYYFHKGAFIQPVNTLKTTLYDRKLRAKKLDLDHPSLAKFTKEEIKFLEKHAEALDDLSRQLDIMMLQCLFVIVCFFTVVYLVYRWRKSKRKNNKKIKKKYPKHTQNTSFDLLFESIQ